LSGNNPDGKQTYISAMIITRSPGHH